MSCSGLIISEDMLLRLDHPGRDDVELSCDALATKRGYHTGIINVLLNGRSDSIEHSVKTS